MRPGPALAAVVVLALVLGAAAAPHAGAGATPRTQPPSGLWNAFPLRPAEGATSPRDDGGRDGAGRRHEGTLVGDTADVRPGSGSSGLLGLTVLVALVTLTGLAAWLCRGLWIGRIAVSRPWLPLGALGGLGLAWLALIWGAVGGLG